MAEKKDYKKEHAKFHEAYKNEHWALKAKIKEDPSLKEEVKRSSKEFFKTYGMPKYPMMADIFDVAEEDRAEPNSRTPFSAEIKVVKNVVYKTVNGEELVMDLYFPKDQMHKAPVVMDIPGGGWMPIYFHPLR